jgi:DNA-binding transcriptional LysR family regulator
MTLRQIEVFQAIARERSFTRAAERIHLSQPTMSEHVRELEEELGTPLFDRRARSTTLTEAGRVFERYASRITSMVADARQAIVELAGLTRGALTVGASTTPGIYLLPQVLATFRGRYPGIEVRLETGNSKRIEERIRAHELDLGVVGGHVLGPGEQCLAAGLVDELVLIVAPDHAMATRKDIAPGVVAKLPLLMREEGSATRQVTERALQHAGISFATTMELDHTESIKQAVMAGLGVAFVSVHAIRGELASHHLRTVRVRGLRIRRHFHVIHDPERMLTASARAFMVLLAEPGISRGTRADVPPKARARTRRTAGRDRGRGGRKGHGKWTSR